MAGHLDPVDTASPDRQQPVAAQPPARSGAPAGVGVAGFRPLSQRDLAPSGVRAKVDANLAALTVLRDLTTQDRAATLTEQRLLARWSGWGAVPGVFDPTSTEFADAGEQLRGLLSPADYRAASRTTLNAHYTDAAVVAAMWEFITAAGFDSSDATVLEPGCGAGTFLGFAPPGARVVGVELDPTSAAIAAVLYPGADIRAESFADTRVPVGSVDLTIGNVPFGKTVLHDRVHNGSGHGLHNYFIIKSLNLTRPGGVVAVITSHWTMDSRNPAARREIAALADLVTAIRLPITTHEKTAGTRVVTDLLVLRRRAPGGEPGTNSEASTEPGAASEPGVGGLAWEQTVGIGESNNRPGATNVAVNEYFVANPDRVIGTLGTRHGQWGPEVDVRYDGDVAAALSTRLTETLRTHHAAAPGSGLFSIKPTPVTTTVPVAGRVASFEEDHLDVDGHGGFTIVRGGQVVPYAVPASQGRELTELLGLRDVTLDLLNAEATSAEDSEHIGGLRQQLGQRYDDYVARFGPINRVTFRRTGRTDPDTGEERLARVRPPQGRFRDDPHAPAVYALEAHDPVAGTTRKASIMSGRVIGPPTPRLGADSAEDAIAISLDSYGEVRLPDVARLLGTSPDQARTAMAGLVFNDPTQPERLVPAAEYLSGNVRTKLTTAQAAHTAAQIAPAAAAVVEEGSGRWVENVAALRAVIPPDLSPAEIDARLGASWISADIVSQFLTETLDDPTVKVEHPGGSMWTVRGNRHSVLATTTFGTGRVNAIDLTQAILEQRHIRVMDELPDGKHLLNLTETVAAQEKATQLGERFADWIWSDPTRAHELAHIYNETFNAIVLRNYDATTRQLPGLALGFIPRAHQIAAISRIVAEPSVLLAHDVGAGKTAEMTCGMMELRRLRLVNKPAVVVPNHMLHQFTTEWMQLYPQARILATGIEDLVAGKRRLMVGRIATGDWDAVIMSRSAFERLPLSAAAQRTYLDNQLDDLRTQLANSRAAGGLSVKRIEGMLARAEEHLKKLTDTEKDPGITFEATGIDYVCVDEAHAYKNLRTPSNIPGVAIDGSGRATDLDMKIDYLRTRRGSRVATFATATPIANSVSEAYVMMRYLRPDVLVDAGITDFDSWAATFGEVTTDLELSPDGSRYRMASRFAKFRNVPELLRMWHLSADIKTAHDLQLPVPDLAGGQPHTVVIPASTQLSGFMAELADRADRVQSRTVDPTEDNMLRIATHGRMAALDLRLLGHDPGPDTKIVTAAARIAAIHHANADRTYPGQTVPGALQLVFCDLGTPRDGWNVYDELRTHLINHGVPDQKIRYVHSARNDREKGELFTACRTGGVSVLIGSTERMGVGTNVQARAIALHHLDCPWRPADLAQREGRILRQGNNNLSVEIVRYVSEGSFDAYLWQTVERKARFISQVMRGRLDVREIEDVGDTALSYSEVKALATGDPRILEKARADADLTRLERLERAHLRTRRTLSDTVNSADRRLPVLAGDLNRLDTAIGRQLDTRGEKFTATIGGEFYRNRGDAAIALRNQLTTHLTNQLATAFPHAASTGTAAVVPVGEIGGFTVVVSRRTNPSPHLRLELAGVPRSGFDVNDDELRADKTYGLITRLENRVSALPATRTDIAHEINQLDRERQRATTELDTPFPHTQALQNARARAANLTAALTKTLHSHALIPTAAASASPAASSPAVPGSVVASPASVEKPVTESIAETTAVETAAAGTSAAAGTGAAGQRWREICAAIDPRIVEDPHWHVLAAALDRAADTGLPVAETLNAMTADQQPPVDHPARRLHYRLITICDAAATPPSSVTTTAAPNTPTVGRSIGTPPAARTPAPARGR